MKDRKLIPGPGIELWIATIGIGAFLLGGLVEFDRDRPRVGAVRLNDLTAEMIERSVRVDAPDREIAEAARAWAIELEKALAGVAERHGVALFPAEVVAAGAPDYTGQVREAMAGWESSIVDAGSGAADGPGAGPAEDRQ